MKIEDESIQEEFRRIFKSDMKKVQSFDLGKYLLTIYKI